MYIPFERELENANKKIIIVFLLKMLPLHSFTTLLLNNEKPLLLFNFR